MRTTGLAISKFALVILAALVFMTATPTMAADETVPVGDDNGVAANAATNEAQQLPSLPKPTTAQAKASATAGESFGSAAMSQSAIPQVPASDISPVSSDALVGFGPSSGTVVGNRALELRDEVLRLRSSVSLSANEFSLQRANGAAGAVQYHSTVAAITARLQNGTTRGNPILLRQWDEAEASLNEVTNSLNRLNTLQTSVSADASLASYLLESVQAGFQLSGAVDEDHDQLKLLRDEISRMVVQLDYLRNQVADDIQRQTTYLTSERSNLQTLAFAISRGELMGNSLANRTVIVNPSPVAMLPQQPMAPTAPMMQQPAAYSPAPAAAPAIPVSSSRLSPASAQHSSLHDGDQLSASSVNLPTGDVGVAPTTGRLLVLIRYNQPTVDYEEQLSRAVSAALQRQPDAEFSVVAVAPTSGDPSEIATAQETAGRNAESVKRSLIQLGLAPAKISMGSTQVETAQLPEVHVYVR